MKQNKKITIIYKTDWKVVGILLLTMFIGQATTMLILTKPTPPTPPTPLLTTEQINITSGYMVFGINGHTYTFQLEKSEHAKYMCKHKECK